MKTEERALLGPEAKDLEAFMLRREFDTMLQLMEQERDSKLAKSAAMLMEDPVATLRSSGFPSGYASLVEEACAMQIAINQLKEFRSRKQHTIHVVST